ncbi:UDP-N-acetylenolpyruvoylglucosamine reductase [mine drainage metagenome]|uniref:UDP-N-acetylmuramate dehydrogenase n=1 Tax=mine drainage metagenome TaxID=410659 RepID=A0A1J5PSL5_9ZZZZ
MTCEIPEPLPAAPTTPVRFAAPGRSTPSTLAELTTLRVGGPVGRYVETSSEQELVAAVEEADRAGEPLLVVGGGSNLLVADAGFPGVVVRDVRTTIAVPDASACAGTTLTVSAGTRWDDVVAYAVAQELVGIEALSGIPGSTGATPVQNVGAYGQEVSQTIALVRVWDRERRAHRTMSLVELGFGYRTSVLKASMAAAGSGGAQRWTPTPRHVVLDVTFQLRSGSLSAPIAYVQLASHLGITTGGRAPLADVRAAVLELRRAKGMVLDPTDHDTWSAGSFFTNPVLDAAGAADLPAAAPRYPSGPDQVKTSAAWLIEHAGFARGFGLPGPAALSTSHALAITNRGGATAEDVLALARTVRDGVRGAFGVDLVPEPVMVGCTV